MLFVCCVFFLLFCTVLKHTHAHMHTPFRVNKMARQSSCGSHTNNDDNKRVTTMTVKATTVSFRPLLWKKKTKRGKARNKQNFMTITTAVLAEHANFTTNDTSLISFLHTHIFRLCIANIARNDVLNPPWTVSSERIEDWRSSNPKKPHPCKCRLNIFTNIDMHQYMHAMSKNGHNLFVCICRFKSSRTIEKNAKAQIFHIVIALVSI